MSENNFWKGVMIGAVAGVIGGILFAPKSGKETRKDLAKYYEPIKKDLIAKLAKLQKFSQEKYDEIVDAVVDYYERDKKINKTVAKKVKKDLHKGYKEVKKAVKDVGNTQKKK